MRSGPRCPQRRNVCVGAGRGRLSKFLEWSGRRARPSFATRCFEPASWTGITNNLGRRYHELTAAEKLVRRFDSTLSSRPLHRIVAAASYLSERWPCHWWWLHSAVRPACLRQCETALTSSLCWAATIRGGPKQTGEAQRKKGSVAMSHVAADGRCTSTSCSVQSMVQKAFTGGGSVSLTLMLPSALFARLQGWQLLKYSMLRAYNILCNLRTVHYLEISA